MPLDCQGATMPWLWLGTWSLGGEGFGKNNAKESLSVLEKAIEKGIRHIDTAGFYAHGRSETLIAKIVGNERKKVFISTKGGLVWEGRNVFHRGTEKNLRNALESSLERLKTDYIDLYQLHWPDPDVPLSESLQALKELKDEGLIRFWGIGNLQADEIERHIKKEAFIPHQVHFNPLHRSDSILKAGRQHNRCYNCVTSPLEQGLLANSRSATGLDHLGKRDVRYRNPHFHSSKDKTWLATFRQLTQTSVIPKVSLILLWILSQDTVDVVIPGPRRVTQLNEILELEIWMKKLGVNDFSKGKAKDWEKNLEKLLDLKIWKFLASPPPCP